MVKIDKIYTKTGDSGETHLVGGKRVKKDSARVWAYGEVDELNSILGAIRTLASEGGLTELAQKMALVQNELFDAGAELATPAGAEWPNMKQLGDSETARLESWIDQITEQVPALRSFVLPGGSILNSWFHLARAVCRRAERRIVNLMQEEKISPKLVVYFNRLSDYLFAQARFESLRSGQPEYLWDTGKDPK